MENEIKSSKKELLDTIHNLMAVIDTPIGRRQVKGSFADEARIAARKIMEENNRSLCYENPLNDSCVECGKPMNEMEHNYGTPEHLVCIHCYNDEKEINLDHKIGIH